MMTTQINENHSMIRNYGVDMYRIVCTVFVCLLHTLNELFEFEYGSIGYWLSIFLRIVCLSCVNGYALISGYVGYNSRHRLSGIVHYWLIVTFYGIVSWLIFSKGKNLFGAIRLVFPVMSVQYWYFSAYFLLFFLIPVVSIFTRNAKMEHLLFGVFSVALMSFGATVLPAFQEFF